MQKVIVIMAARAPTLGSLKHNFKALPTRCEAEREFGLNRVFAIHGDLGGVGVIPKKSGMEKSLYASLTRGMDSSGRNLRQIILSAEDMPVASSEKYNAQLKKLMAAAKRWIDTYAPGARWVATAHQDRDHPHVHIVFQNWDIEKNKRLDFRPKDLHEMQKMEWCKDLFVSGKGSRKKAIAGKKLEASCAKIEDLTWQQRVELGAWFKSKKQKKAAISLKSYCDKNLVSEDLDLLREHFINADKDKKLPLGWTFKYLNKNKKLSSQPSLKIDGVTLRLVTYLENIGKLKSDNDQSKDTRIQVAKDIGDRL